MTTDVESNIKNYASYHINRCNLCPTFRRVAGKYIIQSFYHLIILWVLNPVESFVGDVGMEVFSNKCIQLSVVFWNL